VRKREFEVLGEKLLDVWALDVFSLLEFYDFEDLFVPRLVGCLPIVKFEGPTWIDRKRDRCLAAMSWYKASTASVLDISRYSLYIL
jgi:hypothetical protein